MEKIKIIEKLVDGTEIVHSVATAKGLDKIIVVIAYKNDETKEVGEDTLILNIWNQFRDVQNFRDELNETVNALCKLKKFTSAKICSVMFSRTEQLQEDIECLKKDFAKLDGDIEFNLEDWNDYFAPNGQYIGPFGR